MPENSSDYLQKLNDSLGVVIFTVKIPERVIEYANRAIWTVFGYKPDECIGKKTKIFYPSVEEYQDFGRSLESAMKEGKDELREERLFKRKNGEIFPCEVTTTFLKENEKIVRVISILQDVTERKKTEEELRQYGHIVSCSTDMLALLNERFIYLAANQEYLSALKRTHKELIGHTVSEVFGEEFFNTVVKSNAERALAGEEVNYQEWFKFPAYERRYMDIAYYPYLDENNKVIGFVVNGRNITERKKAEDMLREQKKALEQKNIALSEILGQIEIEKKQIKDNVIANAENLLLPIIQKLRLKGESRKYVQLLRKNLQELTSSFGKKLIEKETRLTSREIEICNMIRNGITSKEIASLLGISLGTTERHRNNIRRKLDIVNKDINLSTALKTL